MNKEERRRINRKVFFFFCQISTTNIKY
jgi:hypothetical protein